MWNKTEVTPLGRARLIVTNPANRKKYSVEFVVINEELLPLMGARAAQHMKLHDHCELGQLQASSTA